MNIFSNTLLQKLSYQIDLIDSSVFNRNVLMLGYGAVARSVLPFMIKLADIKPEKITIIDKKDKKDELQPWIKKGVKFIKENITEVNLKSILDKYLIPNDMLVDVAYDLANEKAHGGESSSRL